MPNPLVPLALLLTALLGLFHPAVPAQHGQHSHGKAASSRVATADADPFRQYAWANYQGSGDQTYLPYQQATGSTKETLGRIALQPKAKWFGAWIPDAQIGAKVRDYITNAQAGNPETLVQMTIFRMSPWEQDACSRLPTRAEQASYKAWINGFAAAVGNTPTAIILQPDGPFALCAPHGSTLPSNLVSYAARVLSAQPRTSVYIEAGAADWPADGGQGGVAAAATIVRRGGIAYARGFALNSTHYDSLTDEITRAAGISQALAAAGYPGRTAVINTSTNGHPFQFGHYRGSDPENPRICPSATAPSTATCITLGVPPTADVTNARWRLPAVSAQQAQQYVDAYLWVGRPWLYRQADPFVMSRALALVNSWPWG